MPVYIWLTTCIDVSHLITLYARAHTYIERNITSSKQVSNKIGRDVFSLMFRDESGRGHLIFKDNLYYQDVFLCI